MLGINRFALLAVAGIWMISSMSLFGQDSYPMEIKLTGPAGSYNVQRWKQDWPGCKTEFGVRHGRVSMIDLSKKKGLRVTCQANQSGAENGGVRWRRPLPAVDRLELAYVIRLSDDFDFAQGGMLPGLCGGHALDLDGMSTCGTHGFSAQFVWRADGRGEAIACHLGHADRSGERIPFSEEIRFPRGKPFMLIMRMDMNASDQADGTFEAWVKTGEQDAIKVISRDNLRWRSDDAVRVDGLLFEVFYKGPDAQSSPKKNCTVDLADFRLL